MEVLGSVETISRQDVENFCWKSFDGCRHWVFDFTQTSISMTTSTACFSSNVVRTLLKMENLKKLLNRHIYGTHSFKCNLHQNPGITPSLFGKKGSFHPFLLTVGILSPLILHYHVVNLISS